MRSCQLILILTFVVGLSGCNFVSLSGGSDNSNNNDDGGISAPPLPSSIVIYWSAPTQRVNGEAMSIEEIGGYEIRFKKPDEDVYESYVIDDTSIDRLTITEDNLAEFTIDDISTFQNYTFEIAVFDTDGLFSDFVVATEE